MAKITGNEISPGTMIELRRRAVDRGQDRRRSSPARAAPTTRSNSRTSLNGTKLNQRFRSDEAVDEVYLDKKDFQFLFASGDMLTFMDMETYDQIELAADFVGEPGAVPAGRHEDPGAAV